MNTSALHLVTAHPALRLFDLITGDVPAELADGALCGFDPELHTGLDAFTDETADERDAREQVAKDVCAECPVKVACLRRALRIRPESGVWAGFTAAELSNPAELLDTFGPTQDRAGVA
ncbi:WhiB family transcriptional regulator [Sphaerisporangium sp. NPDC088356]|uniref:WhiB family transcriptional regulator n=1 Tax=Sphaerisporangium sp. NPDC088356 TaxID=3154871 RepID=UPI00343D149A